VANRFTFTLLSFIKQVTPQAFGCTLCMSRWHLCAWNKGVRIHETDLRAHRVHGSLTRRGIIISPFFQIHFTPIQPLLTTREFPQTLATEFWASLLWDSPLVSLTCHQNKPAAIKSSAVYTLNYPSLSLAHNHMLSSLFIT
jgi:hypothetical protein